MYKIFFTLCLAALILIPKLAAAQEIEARVQVNTEQIIPEDRINIQTMESDITTYLNTNRFTDKDWEGDRIPVDVNVVLKGGGGKYSARLFISSTVPERVVSTARSMAFISSRMLPGH